MAAKAGNCIWVDGATSMRAAAGAAAREAIEAEADAAVRRERRAAEANMVAAQISKVGLVIDAGLVRCLL